MKKMSISLVCFSLLACTTIPSRVESLEKSGEMKNEVKRIFDIASRCWSREQTPLVDGKRVKVRTSIEGYTEVSEHDYASDLGENAATTIIRFTPKENGYYIKIEQREIGGALKPQDDERDKFWNDIKRWVNGDEKC